MPGSEHFTGSSESLPVCCARCADGVASGRGDRRLLLLAAVVGRGTPGGRDDNHNKIHAQRRMEMVIIISVILS